MIIAISIGLMIILVITYPRDKPYTNEEWEAQCKKDFEKYGPVPDNEE